MSGCPVPRCDATPPKRSIFCVDHYFEIPLSYNKLIHRTQIACERADSLEERQHLHDQLQGYIQSAIRLLPEVHDAA